MRRFDTGWRDGLIAVRHRFYGFEAPAAGMKLPMIEYDRGEPLAVVSYQRRGDELPTGPDVSAAYGAMGRLRRIDGPELPFLTAVYDPRTWAFRVLGHNDAARAFLDSNQWVHMTERQFVANLYRLRGRYVPDLEPFGVTFADASWSDEEPDAAALPAERWPHQFMSERRRNYEPAAAVRMAWRNPTVDIDFAVIGGGPMTTHGPRTEVAMVVDYKAPGARIGLGSTNLKALASLCTGPGIRSVPAFVAVYAPEKPAWTFRVHCLNPAARSLLAYALGRSGDGPDDVDAMAHAISGAEWVDLTERQWVAVLTAAHMG